jgi:hypothetical protein
MADRLLKGITRECITCKGTGIYGTYGGMGWRACPACHGFGVVYNIRLEELQSLRLLVLDKFPDAVPKNWGPYVPIRCPVQNLMSGEMIDAAPGAGHSPVQGEFPF